MKNYYITMLVLLFSVSLFAQWEQVGNSINGDNNNDRFGKTLAINDDGTRIVMGASLSSQSTTTIPYVKAYELVNDVWIQLGTTIMESNMNFGDGFDMSVALSGDGTRIAVGNDNHLDANGRVRLFEFVNEDWMQLGSDIVDIPQNFARLGASIGLSKDGTRIVVGQRRYNNNVGQVKVYEFNGTDLVQLGQALVGTSSEFYGNEVAINDDGTRIATISSNGGATRMYELVGTTWQQLGGVLSIGNQGASSEVSLNGAGDIILIGSPSASANGISSGAVKAYNLVNGNWEQMGSELLGGGENHSFGRSIHINQNGNVIAITSGESAPVSGFAVVYQFENGDWQQVGDLVYGTSVPNLYIASIALSRIGNTFITYSTYDEGVVEAFENASLCPLTITCPTNITAIADFVTCEVTNVALGTPTVSGCPNEAVTNDAPTVYELGETTVTWTITNSNGDLETCTQTVTVLDETDPDFDLSTLPDDTTVMVNQGEDYILEDFTIDVVATDNCTQGILPLTIEQSPVAGTELPIGTHEITLTATDDAGNTAIYEFDITVEEILGTTDFTVTNIKIFPNPAVAQVNINGLDNLHVASIKLIDVSGRTVLDVKDSFNNDVTISVKSLTAGLYFVNIQYKGGMLVKQLLVK